MSANKARRPTDNSSVRDLQHYLKLSDATLTRLQEEHFVFVRDVKSIPVDRFGELKLPMRDEITLRNFLFPHQLAIRTLPCPASPIQEWPMVAM